ncbi:MAG: prolipoprotein diacylglyceryl transferase [Acidimicrobiia bacterium]|nr:prolipoprotein diacylglyceryl transferase [Acidimicrobiia bacterium]
MEFSLLGAALLAVAAVYAVIYWEAARGNAADCSKDLWDVALGSATAGLVTGRLAAMIIAGTNPLTNPGDILIVRSGVDTGWAAVGALVALAVISRRETVAVAAGLSAASLAGLGAWEAGCLVRDTCHGTVTELPWGISLGGSEIARHPVGIYTGLLFLLAALGVMWLKRRTQDPLLVAGFALAAVGAVRLATEPMRSALGSRPTGWYLAAIVVGLSVAVASRYRSQRAR